MKQLLVILLLTILSGCSTIIKQSSTAGKVKNVILIIGDGMGPAQIGLLEAYARQSDNPTIKNRVTAFKRMLDDGGILGVSMTYANDVLVTDSAASATQLASGVAAYPETIGIDSNAKAITSILAIAQKMSKSTGLVSDTRVTHATPAAFAAHQQSRALENEIAVDMLNTGPDVMLSGGLRHWIPKQANDPQSIVYLQIKDLIDSNVKIKSNRKDDRNLLLEAQNKGYQLAFSKDQLDQANGKILGLFSNSQFPDALITHRDQNKSSLPSLAQMSSKALQVLDQNEHGFFLMIEGGLIDWAAHNNDTGTMLHEMLKMNETLNTVLDWAKDRDDTLVVVTADHETGGFGFSFSAANIPTAEKLPDSAFDDFEYQPNFNYGSPDLLEKIYQQKLSFPEIFARFDSLPIEQRTAKSLMGIVNQSSEFKITEEQAARVLATENNPFFSEGHRYLSSKKVPKFLNHDAFFVYQLSDNRRNLLAIELAEQQSVVWSNGTHTASPVLVFASGNKTAAAPFSQFMGHPQLGQLLIKSLGGQ